LWSNSSLEKTSRPLKFTTDSNNSMGKSVSYGDCSPYSVQCHCTVGAVQLHFTLYLLIFLRSLAGYSLRHFQNWLPPLPPHFDQYLPNSDPRSSLFCSPWRQHNSASTKGDPLTSTSGLCQRNIRLQNSIEIWKMMPKTRAAAAFAVGRTPSRVFNK